MEQRNTPQRQAILKQLQGRTDHPTAETLYAELKPAWPHLSLGTVYRNLAQLCRNGQARKVLGDIGADRYDPNTMEHHHMTCLHCGGMCDVPSPIAGVRGAENFRGEIQSMEIRFTGICPACKMKERAAKTTDTHRVQNILFSEGEEL